MRALFETFKDDVTAIKIFQILWGGHILILIAMEIPLPPIVLMFLSCGTDVQLTLQDVVDDRLAQVVDDMAVTVL